MLGPRWSNCSTIWRSPATTIPPFDDRDSSDRGQEFDTRLALGLEGAKDALDCRFSNFGDRFPEDLEHLVD